MEDLPVDIKHWDPIIDNIVTNYNSNTINHLIYVFTIIRKFNIIPSHNHWEILFKTYINNNKKTKFSNLFNYDNRTILTLLDDMTTIDNIIPNKNLLILCIIYYGSIDEPYNVIKIIKLMKSYKYKINEEFINNIKNMRRLYVVLEYLENN